MSVSLETGQGFLALLTYGLAKAGHKRSSANLGDRISYIGLSDIGKAVSCLRSAIVSKLRPSCLKPEKILSLAKSGDHDSIIRHLNRLLVLERGHWLETGIEDAFRESGVSLMTQVEIWGQENDLPLKAHLDFILIKPGKPWAVRIVELKSTAQLPEKLLPGYEAQLYGQLGFLEKQWSRSAFSICGGEFASFPELAFRETGQNLPGNPEDIWIDGFVLCISAKQAKLFGPYRPSPAMTGFVERMAAKMRGEIQAIKAGEKDPASLSICPGLQPFCSLCPDALGCPKFTLSSLISDAGI